MARCHSGRYSVALRLAPAAVFSIDPARVAALVVLLLPDRHPVLDLVDDVAAGVEGLAPMSRADPDPDRQLANRQRSDSVRAARVLDTESLTRFGEYPLAFAHRERFEAFVFQPEYRATVVMVAHPALERGIAAAGRVLQLGAQLLRLQWRVMQAETVHGTLTSCLTQE